MIKELEDCDLINERMMMMKLKTAQEPPFVFQNWTPDSSYNQDGKDELFSLLQNQLNMLPRESKKIILGDFYGKVCTNSRGGFRVSQVNHDD